MVAGAGLVAEIEVCAAAGCQRFKGSVAELYEVATLPGKRLPELVEPGAELTNNSFILDLVVADTSA